MSCASIVIETYKIWCIQEDEGVRLKYCQCLCVEVMRGHFVAIELHLVTCLYLRNSKILKVPLIWKNAHFGVCTQGYGGNLSNDYWLNFRSSSPLHEVTTCFANVSSNVILVSLRACKKLWSFNFLSMLHKIRHLRSGEQLYVQFPVLQSKRYVESRWWP